MRNLKFIIAIWGVLSCFIIQSCKKNSVIDTYNPINNPTIPDFTSKVNASVTGFITNEAGQPIAGVVVESETTNTTTNQFGYFKISSTPFSKSAGFIKITKAGYFTGYKTFFPVEGKDNFIRLQLVPATIIGTVESGIGGTITTLDNASITLPANAVVTASNSTPYNGVINIAAHWYNPTVEQTHYTMPGNLTGIDAEGHFNTLITYGMLAVELTGSNGELLQLAIGSKATLQFPLPTSIEGNAPTAISLWYFDETKGVWQQDGSAMKNNGKYEGQVRHLSFWNCDVGIPLVNLQMQLLDTALHPISNQTISIADQSNSNNIRYGTTNNEGFVYGYVPANTNLAVNLTNICNQNILVKNITTANNRLDEGSVKVNTPLQSFTLTANVNKCNGTPVTNGVLIMQGLNGITAAEVINGNINYTGIACPSTNVVLYAIDREAQQQSSPVNYTIVPGLQNAGAVSACNPVNTEYISIDIDGGITVLDLSQNIFNADFFITPQDSTSIGALETINMQQVFLVNFKGASTAGTYHISNNSVSINGETYQFTAVPKTITVTSYGLIGQFIIADFGGQAIRLSDSTIHIINCTLNIKRDS